MTISNFTPVQYQIFREIVEAITLLGGNLDLIAPISSLGDTLPDADVLEMLEQWRSAQTDRMDMWRDEFLRIKACPGCDREIAGLCDRALSEIKRRVPLLVDAERHANRLSEVFTLLDDITLWMVENDYECGPKGSETLERIVDFLKRSR